MTAWQKQQLLPIRQNRKYSPGCIHREMMDITEQKRNKRSLPRQCGSALSDAEEMVNSPCWHLLLSPQAENEDLQV